MDSAIFVNAVELDRQPKLATGDSRVPGSALQTLEKSFPKSEYRT
ncbi:hypothetical protein [Lentzea sp. NPDC003310]